MPYPEICALISFNADEGATGQDLHGDIPKLCEVEEARIAQYRCECILNHLLNKGM